MRVEAPTRRRPPCTAEAEPHDSITAGRHRCRNYPAYNRTPRPARVYLRRTTRRSEGRMNLFHNPG